MALELLKSNLFRSENFNIFYDLEPEKFPDKPLRSPTWPEKNPIYEKKIPIYEEKIFISEVEKPDFEQNKRRETPCFGLSPLR